jgi:hypothetical protein
MPDGVADLRRLIEETTAEVDHLDWSLMEIKERICASKDADASSREAAQ